MCGVIYKPENLDRLTSLEWAGIWGILGDENLPPRGEKGWSEIGRGERKHLLFLGAAYGNRVLIMASLRRWLRTRREMKRRHMTVVLKERREKLPVGILLLLTIMSSSGAKPPLKLLALGKCVFFSLSTNASR